MGVECSPPFACPQKSKAWRPHMAFRGYLSSVLLYRVAIEGCADSKHGDLNCNSGFDYWFRYAPIVFIWFDVVSFHVISWHVVHHVFDLGCCLKLIGCSVGKHYTLNPLPATLHPAGLSFPVRSCRKACQSLATLATTRSRAQKQQPTYQNCFCAL